ncbi:MAG: sigma-54-dependent Fis family transcriptional regulator [Planctomycetes bacterium]|nr:sigma-54-dependent Fis family transcriptional regulator [Planctomycetota bacterium]
MANICVVDDKELLRESLAATLEREDHRVTAFGRPDEALPAITQNQYDVVLTDLKMPGMDGVSMLREMRAAGCETPVIVMTAFGSVASAVDAMKLGASDYIQKPFDADMIVVQVERAMKQARVVAENEALRTNANDMQALRQMIGDSDAMIETRIKIARVAASQGTVLVSGESGTGKELVARAIHSASRRASKPMMCLNCAALSENLLESELFGHERGAFTGADRARKGRFEMADEGTLLLDEISEMALPLQAKLLRVLQEGEFERVGSSLTRRASVRIVATTNRDLKEWVRSGQFREDLYYRLHVLPITIAPLRSRVEDVPLLTSHFLAQIARRDGSEPARFEKSAITLLKAYNWPGNVRELENVCERAATLSTERLIPADLIENWLVNTSQSGGAFSSLRHGRMLEDMERSLIEHALEQHGGHREKSAKALGMGVRTLGMKLKQWREESKRSETRTDVPATSSADEAIVGGSRA